MVSSKVTIALEHTSAGYGLPDDEQLPILLGDVPDPQHLRGKTCPAEMSELILESHDDHMSMGARQRRTSKTMKFHMGEEVGMVQWIGEKSKGCYGNLCYMTGTANSYEYTALRCGPCILAPAVSFDFEALISSVNVGTLEEWLAHHILSPCFADMAYTRLPYIFGEGSSASAAMNSFQGNCVAFAEYMHQRLRDELALLELGSDCDADPCNFAFTIPTTLPEAYHQPGYPHWGHAAVAIPLKNHGCIILDPALRLPTPIVLREDGCKYEQLLTWPGGPPIKGLPKASSQEWRFVLDVKAGQVKAFSPQQPGLASFTYFMKPVVNADVAITKPTNDFNKRIPFVKTDAHGAKTAHLSIRMDKFRIEAFVQGVWKDPLPFAALDAESVALSMAILERWLPRSEVCEFTNQASDDFYGQIITIAMASEA